MPPTIWTPNQPSPGYHCMPPGVIAQRAGGKPQAAGGTLAVGLAAFWELEEASGNRADSHTNGYTLTDINTVGQQTGKVGNCTQHEAASSEYLTITDAAAPLLSMGSGVSLTVAAWTYINDGSTDRFILSKSDGGSGTEYALYYAPIFFRFRIHDGTASVDVDNNASGGMAVDTWFLCIARLDIDAGKITLRVNNNTRTETTTARFAQNGASDFRIGAQHNASLFPMQGRIDQGMVWRRALTDAEESYLYNGGAGRSYAEVLAASP